MQQLEWTLDDGRVVTVDYAFTAGQRPMRNDPGYGPEVEIMSVMDDEGEPVKLTPKQEERIRDHIAENAEDWAEGDEADREYDERD